MLYGGSIQHTEELKAMSDWKTVNKDRAYKWLGWVVAAVLAAQIYFVREMVAAEVLFAVVFIALAAAFAVFYGLSAFGIRAVSVAESLVTASAPVIRRGFRQVGEFSRRPFRRLRSASAR
jgi:hypothetical protein